jgi:hypothetical protein
MPSDAEVANDPAVLTAEEAATQAADISSLPEAGEARRDALRARADRLEAAAEQMRTSADIGSIDPSAFKVDREIGQYSDHGRGLDGSEVSGALSEYVYRWEQADIRNQWGGVWVTQSQALGWEIVGGDMPESRERRHVDGTRRWGDTILMRIRRERYEAIQIAAQRRRLARSEGIPSQVLEHAERAGITVHDLEDPNTPSRIKQMAVAQRAAAESARATMVRHMRQARSVRGEAAHEIANRRFDAALRDGKVPGMPAPGVR